MRISLNSGGESERASLQDEMSALALANRLAVEFAGGDDMVCRMVERKTKKAQGVRCASEVTISARSWNIDFCCVVMYLSSKVNSCLKKSKLERAPLTNKNNVLCSKYPGNSQTNKQRVRKIDISAHAQKALFLSLASSLLLLLLLFVNTLSVCEKTGSASNQHHSSHYIYSSTRKDQE